MNEVSLYIPSYNSGRTISFCLEAVLKQAYPIKEILVIDGGSSDDTVGLVSKYPVKLIKQEENSGLAAARNTAIKNIDTEFIASLDSDCVPEPDWLEVLMKKFNSSKIAGIGGKLLEKNSSSACDLWRSVHMKQYWPETEDKPPFLFGSNTVFRREALIKIGFYNEKYKNSYEDVDISRRLKERGYSLVYEPKAVARHFKTDSIYSVFSNFWKWNHNLYQEKGYYLNTENFILKLKHNIGIANNYIEEDFSFPRHQLLYFDFLLPLHHSLRDFEYFIYQGCQSYPEHTKLSFWLSMLDLAFFYRFDYKNNSISTLAPQKLALLQNFILLNLILTTFFRDRFKRSDHFIDIFCRHLFLSVYNIEDNYMVDKLLSLITLRHDWIELLKKKHANLNFIFLENIILEFHNWLGGLMKRFPDLIDIIEEHAKKIDAAVFSTGGYDGEGK